MDREIWVGHTLSGPHKDDFSVVVRGKKYKTRDLMTYGSRGEQRMAVLWLKMCELAFIENKSGQKPVLLLDDIFSELDDEHDGIVMKMVEKQQTILTTTDMRDDFGKLGWKVIELG